MGSSIDDRSIGPPHAYAHDNGWPVDLLQSIWSEQYELLADRIGVIERATSALEDDSLEEGLRVQAQRAAHMLAGSIGVFGFQQAGEAARDLELELELALACPTPGRASILRSLLLSLHQIDRAPASHAGRR
jgi:HPt (histidine-containing phosphotransfer) domain-containing protein